MATIKKPTSWKDKHTEIMVWLPNKTNEHIKEILAKLRRYNIKVSKSRLIRTAIADKLYNLDSMFALLEMAERKGVNIE